MFEVARSRLMCCSRICKAMRSALLPSRSTETPMMRPGMLRLNASRVVMYPAAGPPKPIGVPRRCAEPTAMSAPHSPGAFRSASDSRSAATVTSAPLACAAAVKSE